MTNPPQELQTGRRLAVRHSEHGGDWYVSHSPRNDSYVAEGPWEEWVQLAIAILDAERHRQEENCVACPYCDGTGNGQVHPGCIVADVCFTCGGEGHVPIDTPVGQEAVAKSRRQGS